MKTLFCMPDFDMHMTCIEVIYHDTCFCQKKCRILHIFHTQKRCLWKYTGLLIAFTASCKGRHVDCNHDVLPTVSQCNPLPHTTQTYIDFHCTQVKMGQKQFQDSRFNFIRNNLQQNSWITWCIYNTKTFKIAHNNRDTSKYQMDLYTFKR